MFGASIWIMTAEEAKTKCLKLLKEIQKAQKIPRTASIQDYAWRWGKVNWAKADQADMINRGNYTVEEAMDHIRRIKWREDGLRETKEKCFGPGNRVKKLREEYNKALEEWSKAKLNEEQR